MRYITRTIEYNIPDRTIRLAVFSDLHVGHAQFARRHFKKFIEQHLDHPHTYFIGIGDQLDCLIPSDKKRFRMSGVEEKYLRGDNPDEILNQQIDDLCELLEPIKSRLLGLTIGNHEDIIASKHGLNVHRIVCDRLGVENLGYSCLYLLKLTEKEGTGRTRSLRIYCNHGFGGGGRTEGGSITKYSRFITHYDADLFLTGHDHDAWFKKVARIGINNSGKMYDKPIGIVNSGSFKKSLTDGDVPSWEETKGFPPRPLGGIAIEIEVDTHGWLDFSVV